MISVIQLVTHAEVAVDSIAIGSIQKGIMALVGIEKTDSENEADKLFNKIINYRIFPDAQGKMNLSLKDIRGGLLLVPQFTLVAETTKGTRPGFSTGMPPQEGKQLFEYLVEHAQKQYDISIARGCFGACMQVSLCNDGPVTFILQV
ncbi:MAG: D-aminoacyl-tRNA deacylase [Legionella sp.]|uniref:D-aminoacyl-tRNA deacylase n=1 Tax=Legionella sp. TaxID=459 RepID=UPI0039E621F6